MSKKKRKFIKGEILNALLDDVGQPFQIIVCGFGGELLGVKDKHLETGGKYDLYALTHEVAEENDMMSVELEIPDRKSFGDNLKLYLPKNSRVNLLATCPSCSIMRN